MSKPMTPKEKREYQEFQDMCQRIRKSSAPTKSETPAIKAKRIKRLLKKQNWQEFILYYFGGDDGYASAPFGYFHKEAGDAILINKENKVALEWSRELGKSVFVDVFMSIHKLVSGDLTGLILVSETEGKAKKLIKDIQVQLLSNQRLINDFGDFKVSGSWKDGYFVTEKGIGFWAFGMGQNPAGTREGSLRPNVGILDDVDNKDVAKNQQRLKERMDWILGEFFGCFSTKDWQIILANNRVCKDGIVANFVGDLEEGDPINDDVWHSKVFWTEDPKTHKMLMPDEGGIPSWHENYTPEEAIAKIKGMGRRNAMRQLYHTDIKEGGVFTDDMLPYAECLPLHEYDALLSYCDPAYGESKKGCYKCVALVGLKGHDYDIIKPWIRQSGSFAKAQYELSVMVKENGLWRITNGKASDQGLSGFEEWVEANNLQKPHLKRIYREHNLSLKAPWSPRLDMDNKGDKIGRIEGLETTAENGHMRFNIALKHDPDMKELRDQFLDFPYGFIDGPDTIQGAIAKLEKKIKSKKSKPRLGNYIKSKLRMG